MSHGMFYLIEPETAEDSEAGLLAFVNKLTVTHYSQGQRIYLLAKSRRQAELLDELLWQQEPSNFVPHNLVGEGPRGGAPVEIGWPGLRHSGHRSVLINLAQDAANFAVTFALVVDFVPCDEKSKQQARERYKIYRQAGIQLQTLAINQTQ